MIRCPNCRLFHGSDEQCTTKKCLLKQIADLEAQIDAVRDQISRWKKADGRISARRISAIGTIIRIQQALEQKEGG